MKSVKQTFNLNEPIMCVFFVPREKQWERRLFQGSPELFSPSVMREGEELWRRD